MSIFNHATIGCADLAVSTAFYDAVLGAIGINNLGTIPGKMSLYGADHPELIVRLPFDGNPACVGNGMMIAFKASSKAQIDAFHAAGLTNGGTCEGKPGNREAGPPGNYVAYVRDPVGNKLAAVAFTDA